MSSRLHVYCTTLHKSQIPMKSRFFHTRHTSLRVRCALLLFPMNGSTVQGHDGSRHVRGVCCGCFGRTDEPSGPSAEEQQQRSGRNRRRHVLEDGRPMQARQLVGLLQKTAREPPNRGVAVWRNCCYWPTITTKGNREAHPLRALSRRYSGQRRAITIRIRDGLALSRFAIGLWR